MPEDFTDHERWGLVIDKYRSVQLEFQIQSKRDALRIRGIIPKFHDMPMSEFLTLIGDAKTYVIDFPKEYGDKIVAAAKQNEIDCTIKDHERLDYLIYDIAARDLLELDDDDEYLRIVGILRENKNPIIEVNEY